MSDRASRLRQRLRRSLEQGRRAIEDVLREEGPLLRGSLGTRARVCGKAGCRCARGARHVSRYLAASVSGRTRQVHVPAKDEARVALGVARYRRFRGMRERLARLGELQLRLLDELKRALVEPYPPDRPLPLPKTRSTRPR